MFRLAFSRQVAQESCCGDDAESSAPMVAEQNYGLFLFGGLEVGGTVAEQTR
jgi:hypothetical protein